MTRYLIPLITALVLATTACATSPRQNQDAAADGKQE